MVGEDISVWMNIQRRDGAGWKNKRRRSRHLDADHVRIGSPIVRKIISKDANAIGSISFSDPFFVLPKTLQSHVSSAQITIHSVQPHKCALAQHHSAFSYSLVPLARFERVVRYHRFVRIV